jgi:DNA-binding GntR family transcriptional regulator
MRPWYSFYSGFRLWKGSGILSIILSRRARELGSDFNADDESHTNRDAIAASDKLCIGDIDPMCLETRYLNWPIFMNLKTVSLGRRSLIYLLFSFFTAEFVAQRHSFTAQQFQLSHTKLESVLI